MQTSVRIILATDKRGEVVVFTDDHDSPVEDFIPLEAIVDFDQEVTVPASFLPALDVRYIEARRAGQQTHNDTKDRPLYSALQEIRARQAEGSKPLSRESERQWHCEVHETQIWQIGTEYYEVQFARCPNGEYNELLDNDGDLADIRQVWPREVTTTVFAPEEP